MSPPSERTVAHLDDAELLSLADGEAHDALAAAETHLSACADCSRRLEIVRGRNEALSAILARASVQPLDGESRRGQREAIEARLAYSSRRRARPMWRSPLARAAAGIVIAASLAAAAPPIRSWIASHISAISQPEVTPVPAGVKPQPNVAPNEVYFPISGTELAVTLTSSQLGGRVIVRRADDTRSSASVVGGSAELVVLPDGVRIRNQTTSSASYVLRAGTGVQRVRVRVSDASGGHDTVMIVPDFGSISLPLDRRR
jgi:hypothetical protein